MAFQKSANPPRQTPQFTEAEMQDIVGSHFKGQIPKCPADGTIVDVSEEPYFGGTSVTLNCPKCGKVGNVSR
ncbi:MAG TPA: hypothetical protein VGZ47_04200 [Gemmataceae bacterium]|jgi:hypothetical protein|nr:hypothetical protein [Gemmataceae bacterium]